MRPLIILGLMLSYSAWADDLKGCYVQIKEYRKFKPGLKQYEWVWYKNIKNTVKEKGCQNGDLLLVAAASENLPITQEKILKEIPV